MKLIQQTCKWATAAFAITTASAAPFQFNDGDLILGVQAYGGTGSSRNVFFNVGAGTVLRDDADKGQLGNIGATLTKVFGANWYSRTDLYFGVIGNLSASDTSGIFGAPPVNGDPSRTFYLGQPATAPGQAALIPANLYVSGALGSAATKLSGMESMIVGTTATAGLEAEADGSAILDQTAQAVEWNNSWTIWNPSLGDGLGPAFDTFNGGIQQNFGKSTAATYLDIQRVLATNSRANPTGVEGGGTYETTIAITNAGAVIAQTTAITSTPEIDVELPAGSPAVDNTGTTNFGSVTLGSSSAALSMVITNDGSAALTGLAITKAGSNAADFTVGDLASNSLPAGDSVNVSIVFKPSAAGNRSATIRIASNDANEDPFDINVAGTGAAAQPEIDLFVSNLPLTDGRSSSSFGSVKLGSSSPARTFTIRNTGGSDLKGLKVSLTGTNSKDFKITQPRNSIVKAGSSTSFTVSFKPTATGSRRAALVISSNDADENPYDIGLSGIALSSPAEIEVLQPETSQLADGKSKKSFGTVKIGQTGAVKTFTIRNAGGATLTNLGIKIAGPQAAEFIITKPKAKSLAIGKTTTFTVKFKPKATGTRKATLQISSNDANENPFDIPVTGLGAK